MTPEQPSRWRSGLMVMVLVTVLLLIVATASCAPSPTDAVGGRTGDDDASSREVPGLVGVMVTDPAAVRVRDLGLSDG